MESITRRTFLRSSAIATGAAASVGLIGSAASKETNITVAKAPSQGTASQNWQMEELANNLHKETWDQKFYKEYLRANRHGAMNGH